MYSKSIAKLNNQQQYKIVECENAHSLAVKIRGKSTAPINFVALCLSRPDTDTHLLDSIQWWWRQSLSSQKTTYKLWIAILEAPLSLQWDVSRPERDTATTTKYILCRNRWRSSSPEHKLFYADSYWGINDAVTCVHFSQFTYTLGTLQEESRVDPSALELNDSISFEPPTRCVGENTPEMT